MLLPPLESLRFFEAAARRQSFARAASELGVTAAAVAHRIRTLENHLDAELFDRRQRGVSLNHRGQTPRHAADCLSYSGTEKGSDSARKWWCFPPF